MPVRSNFCGTFRSCCFAGNGKEMYQNVKRMCRGIVFLLIKLGTFWNFMNMQKWRPCTCKKCGRKKPFSLDKIVKRFGQDLNTLFPSEKCTN